jgi:hypothetical protein
MIVLALVILLVLAAAIWGIFDGIELRDKVEELEDAVTDLEDKFDDKYLAERVAMLVDARLAVKKK